MLGKEFDLRRVHDAVGTEPRHRTACGRTGNALVQEMRQDLLVKRLKVMPGIFVDVYRDLLRRTFFEHDHSRYCRVIAAPSHTAMYPSTTLPTTFSKPIH